MFFFFEDLIKTEDAGVAITLKIDFSNIKGQLTPPESNLAQIHTHTSCYGYPCFFQELSKNEEDPIKIEGARVATIQNIDFSNTKGQLTAVRGRIWPKFELSRDIVVILVTCKNEEDPLKNKDARVATTQNIDFSNTQGQITPQSEVSCGRNSNSSEML